MEIPTRLYTFIGCSTAVRYFADQSLAPDHSTAQAAAADLCSVSEVLLDGVAQHLSEEEFKAVLDTQLTTVLTAIETLRGTSLLDGLDATLTSLLEHFYDAADELMGGGGLPNVAVDPSWGTISSYA